MSGLDYAGGHPSGASIAAAGFQFVVRYLSDGGSDLPYKRLTLDEANDLQTHDVDIVSNWETTADMMLAGRDQGVYHAQLALAQHFACGGPGFRPIYFSADFNATPEQQMQIDEYLRGVASVIGLEWTGIYGGYRVVKRALDNGTATWAWQTQAWSGGNQDPRINILQDNDAGYVYVDGTECDLNESLTADYGQWSAAVAPATPPAPSPAPQPYPPPPDPTPPPIVPPSVPQEPVKPSWWHRLFGRHR